MILRITLQQAIQRVRDSKTLADIQSIFKDVFGLTDAQLMGAQHIPGLPDPEAPVELTEAAKMANPDYVKGGGFHDNCQRCGPAYELLRRGIAGAALPNPYPDRNGTSKRYSMNGSECFKNPVIHGYGKDSLFPLSRAELVRSLNLLPNGARATIFWIEPGGAKGHVIVAEKVEGNLVFIDPQTGYIGAEALRPANRQHGYSWFRMDNLELNENFEWDEVLREQKNDRK